MNVDVTHDDIVVWDSGAASFQITKRLANPVNSNKYETYMAPFGTSVVAKLLMGTVQPLIASSKSKSDVNSLDKTFVSLGSEKDMWHSNSTNSRLPRSRGSSMLTPNPVLKEEASLLISELQSRLPPLVPSWLNKSVNIVFPISPASVCKEPYILAIGGRNSMFQVALSILRYHKKLLPNIIQKGENLGNNDMLEYSSLHILTLDEVQWCIETCIGRTDDELDCYISYENADGSSNTISKLCLLYSVMQHLNLQRIQIVLTVGCCAGVLQSSQFWI
jgi:hypothetical protein